MTEYTDEQLLTTSKAWIAEFVIKHKLCPFAHVSYEADTIRYLISEKKSPRPLLEVFYTLCEEMDNDSTISNAFMILPQVTEFETLLAFKDISDVFMEDAELATSYQTVAFHPLFTFEGEGTDHAGNFVNRSPHPMLHILRVAEVSQALESLDDPSSVPRINQEKLEKLGYDYLADLLKKYQG